MAKIIRAQIDGLAGVLGRLASVEKKLRQKTLRKAVGKGGQIVMKDAKTKVRVGVTGQLKRSLGRKTKTYRGTGSVVAIVGPRIGFRQAVGVKKRGKRAGETIYVDPVKYAHLVELGTTHAAAFPFLVPALEDNRGRITDEMAGIIRAGIEGAA